MTASKYFSITIYIGEYVGQTYREVYRSTIMSNKYICQLQWATLYRSTIMCNILFSKIVILSVIYF